MRPSGGGARQPTRMLLRTRLSAIRQRNELRLAFDLPVLVVQPILLRLLDAVLRRRHEVPPHVPRRIQRLTAQQHRLDAAQRARPCGERRDPARPGAAREYPRRRAAPSPSRMYNARSTARASTSNSASGAMSTATLNVSVNTATGDSSPNARPAITRNVTPGCADHRQRIGRVVIERRLDFLVRLRQRHPRLHPVQRMRRLARAERRALGMRDAAARRSSN